MLNLVFIELNHKFFAKIRTFGLLKKTLSIFFLSVYLISSTELNQLMKFPLFIKHFIEHKNKDTQLTLGGFIEMHYAHGDVKDADYDEDMKLPFKTHNTCTSSGAFSFVPDNFEDLSIRPICTEHESFSSYQDKFLTSSYLSSIWQPPRSC